jgi:hypothetical protein
VQIQLFGVSGEPNLEMSALRIGSNSISSANGNRSKSSKREQQGNAVLSAGRNNPTTNERFAKKVFLSALFWELLIELAFFIRDSFLYLNYLEANNFGVIRFYNILRSAFYE